MSKQSEADSERIPSYEESIASSPLLPASTAPTSISTSRKISPRQTIQQRTRHERLRRITALISNHLECAIGNNLEDGITHFLIILLPFDAFPTAANVSESSITSPSLQLPTTLLSLRSDCKPSEREDDYKSSFLIQGIVIHDLTTALHQSMIDPSALYSELLQSQSQTSASTTPTSANTSPELPISTPLPPRPQPNSWFQRKFGLPPADHDPTGSTGKWNLGWRSEEDPASTQANISTGDLSIRTRLQDVSFRTENEMGLLESRSVKCIWLEMDIKS